MLKKLFCLLIFSVLFYGFSRAEEELPVDFGSRSGYWEYEDEGSAVIGRGGVWVKYEGRRITAESAKYDIENNMVFAEGNVTLYEDGDEFHGEKLVYDLNTKKGVFDKGYTFMDPWFCQGDKMEKVADNEYRLRKGAFTTCDLPQPHYRFVASRMKIYPGKRFWAYNVIFYVKGVPLAYVPVFRRSLQRVPYGFVLWPIGHDSKKGWFALSHYNWYVNSQLRGRIYLDYIERLGVGQGFDTSYKLGEFGKETGEGYFYGYFINEKQLAWNEKDNSWDHLKDSIVDRWKIHYRHRQELNKNTVSLIRVDKFSDADFNTDYEDEEKWKGFLREYLEDQNPEGSLSITQSTSNYTSQFYVKKRINDYVGVITEKLPEVSLDFNKQELGDSSFYWDADGGMVYFHEAPQGDEIPGEEDESLQLDSHLELSRPSRIGWLRLEPAVSGQGFWYNKDEDGSRDRFMSNYETSLGMTTTFYSPVFKPGKMQMRHQIQPRLTYYYSPEPTKNRNDLFSFNDRLATEKDYFDLEIINRLVAKDGNGNKRDLIIFSLSSEFYRNHEFLGRGNNAWGDVIADLDFKPTANLRFGGEANYDVNSGWLNKFATDFTLKETKDKWNISLGTEYYDPQNAPGNFDTILSSAWQINPKWKLQIYDRYDWAGDESLDIDGHQEEWRIAVTRDLHCWEGQFFIQREWKQDKDDDFTIFLAFWLKGFPVTPVEIPLN